MTRVPGFLESDVPPAARDRARFEIVPAPLEKSVSYGRGTARGPRALLDASQQLEAFDGRGTPAAAGIHTGAPIGCADSVQSVLRRIEARTAAALAGGRIPVLLGGEHTVALGALRAMARTGRPFGIVQFDAHADLRDRYEGNRLSHACVMRRALEETGAPLFQIGCRAFCEEEAAFRRTRGIGALDADAFARRGLPRRLLPPGFPKTVYLTFDVDALDPAVMPGTGTPVPGGLFWYDALRLLEAATAGRRVAAFDVVELAPVPGNPIAAFTAARLTYAIMGLCHDA